MRKLRRVSLSASTQATLDELTERVLAADDRPAEAKRRWESKPRVAFDDIRSTLVSMATGRARCMYCEDGHGTDIEHFWPKRTYPEKTFKWENYLLACSHCNSNLKREAFPLDSGSPMLIEPTTDEPAHHIVFIPISGKFMAIGAKGEPSIEVFGLNDERTPRNLPKGRKLTFLKLQILLVDFDRRSREGQTAEAQLTKEAILDEAFSAVLCWLVDVAARPSGWRLLREGVPAIVRDYGVAAWL